jgi:hypothetical protein
MRVLLAVSRDLARDLAHFRAGGTLATIAPCLRVGLSTLSRSSVVRVAFQVNEVVKKGGVASVRPIVNARGRRAVSGVVKKGSVVPLSVWRPIVNARGRCAISGVVKNGSVVSVRRPIINAYGGCAISRAFEDAFMPASPLIKFPFSSHTSPFA